MGYKHALLQLMEVVP